MIYKLFTGKYIDLSKIITISDAYFSARTYRVAFNIECQLLENPITYSEIMDEYCYRAKKNSDPNDLLMTDGSWEMGWVIEYQMKSQYKAQGVANLQKKIDEVIEVWKEFKSKNKD